MFGLFKKKKSEPPQPQPFAEIREMLFGDVPLERWRPADGAAHEGPWAAFDEARSALSRNDRASTEQTLRQLLSSPDLESRQRLQAWHVLRQIGVQPDAAEAKQVLGVVLEVPLDAGLDTLAAYRDYGARFISHGGKMIVWETRDPQIDACIDELLAAGQRVADVIGPWLEPRRGPPAQGDVRLNLLTPSGLHFGEGPFEVLSRDGMGGPLIAAGTRLMQALIERASNK